jgi:uncharacterized repeat protein (TIGR04138 family)
MTMHHPRLEEVVQRDPRYSYEAYEFIFAALAHTQKMLGRTPPHPGTLEPDHHVTGPELMAGARELALREFGLMARIVFRMWGINRTADFGEIVFNLVEANLMSKTTEDQRLDFHDVFDLDKALVEGYRIELKEEAEESP